MAYGAAGSAESRRCAACGSESPTSIVPAAAPSALSVDGEHIICISSDGDPVCPRQSSRSLFGSSTTRERVPAAAESVKAPQGPHCRRCSEVVATRESDTPHKGHGLKKGLRPTSGAIFGLSARARRIAVGLALCLVPLHLVLCAVLAHREARQRWSPVAAAAAVEGGIVGSSSSSSTGTGTGVGVRGGGIPKIIHQMYRSGELPERWRAVPAAWAAHHPPSEYTYMLWTDESLRELIAREYPWLLPTYDGYEYPTQRWDASRYAVLHSFGGLYADLDVYPVASVDALIDGHTLLLPHTPNIGLTNAVMASTARHPFLLFVLEQLPAYAHAWYHGARHNTILSSTGSTFIWAVHMRWARDHTADESARLLPAREWGKCSYCERAGCTWRRRGGGGGVGSDGDNALAAPSSAEDRRLATTTVPAPAHNDPRRRPRRRSRRRDRGARRARRRPVWAAAGRPRR